jgi:hypothetical protein
MAYTKYSLTPANNNAAPPDGAPEGMLPSAVNDTMRDMMAQIRDVGDGIRGGTYTMTAPVITGGSITGVALSGNTFTNPVITGGSINNTPIGATTASTGKFSTLTNAALTSGRVTYAGTSGVLQDDADFTFNGTTVTMANDASISGLTVGKGGGAVATNTAVGVSTFLNNTTGSAGTALGFQALAFNTTGGDNTAVGHQAAQSNTTGIVNTAIGKSALFSNTSGGLNTAIGHTALFSNTTADACVAVGYEAAYTQTTGALYTVAIGYRALKANTSGSQNNALGFQALTANTTGANNSGFGTYALASTTTGSSNTSFGNEALRSNTTASNNTAVGYQAGYSNTTGLSNAFFGTGAGYTNATGLAQTFLGKDAGKLSTSNSNTFVGCGAGAAVTTGTGNTIIGRYDGNYGGLDIRTASNYIVLSDGDSNPRGIFDGSGNFLVGATAVSRTGQSRIRSTSTSGALLVESTGTTVGAGALEVAASAAPSNTSNYLIVATTSAVDKFYVYTNGNVVNANNSYGSLSDVTLKENIVDATPKLEKINSVRVVNYNLIGDEQKQIGVIAQELETVFPSIVEIDGKTGLKQVKYSVFVPMLIKAVQELKAEVDSLKQQLGK